MTEAEIRHQAACKRMAEVDHYPPAIKRLVWEYDVVVPKSCWHLPYEEMVRQCIGAVRLRAEKHFGKDHPQAKVHKITLEDLNL